MQSPETPGRSPVTRRMSGKVKWFSAEKGCGFIHGDDGVDRFVHVSAVRGSQLPAPGTEVEFESRNAAKGPKAVDVIITREPVCVVRDDGRINCPGCSKKIVPRVIVNYGEPTQSVCPFCGARIAVFARRNQSIIFVAAIAFFIVLAITNIR